MFDLGKTPFDLKCPKCGKKLRATFQDANRGKVVHCTGCGADIHLSPGKDLDRNVRKVNKSVKDFEKTVKNFDKKFRL